MKFEYRSQGDGIEITAYLDEEPVVCVPEEIDGKPVTAIGKYAFEGKNDLLELKLPKTLESIGAHAFYNCRKLEKISLPDRVTSAEDGAFKNCRSLQSFHIQVYLRKMTCLRDLLSELNQEIHVQMEYMEDRKIAAVSRLVFPKYAFDYVEHTSAKIVNQVTYGSGVHYRECMKEHDVDFRNYDQVFSVALVNDTLETLTTIARYRLEYPYELSKDAEEEYRGYIKEHLKQVISLFVKVEDVAGITFLGDKGFLTSENIDEAILIAHEMEVIECVSVLLEYKNQHFKIEKKSFEL